jgi:tRNA(Arg) A34 adenosine deaminase TadA
MKRTILTILATLFVVGVVMVLPYAWPHIVGGGDLDVGKLTLLSAAGGTALASRDVPVGALLLYGDSVIGTGYNTVKRDGNAGGHAEINAMSEAMGRMGLDAFNRLNKDSMTMVSTFEPCRMCRGALLEYGITHVQFLKAKPVTDWIRADLGTMLRYELRRRQRGPEHLQDSLFEIAWRNY